MRTAVCLSGKSPWWSPLRTSGMGNVHMREPVSPLRVCMASAHVSGKSVCFGEITHIGVCLPTARPGSRCCPIPPSQPLGLRRGCGGRSPARCCSGSSPRRGDSQSGAQVARAEGGQARPWGVLGPDWAPGAIQLARVAAGPAPCPPHAQRHLCQGKTRLGVRGGDARDSAYCAAAPRTGNL